MTHDSFRIYDTSSYGFSTQSWSKEAMTFGRFLIRGRSERTTHLCMKSGLNAVSFEIGEYSQPVFGLIVRAKRLHVLVARKPTKSTGWVSIVKLSRSNDSKHHIKLSKAGRPTHRALS